MVNSELTNILKTFSKAEQKDFLVFLSSPYFKKGKQVEAISRMCSYVFKQFGKKKEDSLLSEAKVYAAVYPNLDKKSKHDLSNLRTAAKTNIQEFFAYEQFKKKLNKKKREMHYARSQAERREAPLAQKIYATLRKWRGESRIEWVHKDFFTALQSVMDESYFLSTQNKHKDDIGMLAILEELECFYLHLKTHYRSLILGQNQNSRLPAELYEKCIQLDIDFDADYFHTAHGHLKLTAYKLLNPNTASEEIFHSLREAIKAIQHRLPYPELSNYRSILLHFIAVYKSYSGDSTRLLFDIQKEEYEPDFPYKPSELSPSKFYACFQHAIKLDELDWAKGFFKKYKGKLIRSESREETLCYCTALLAFAEKNYTQVLPELSKVTFTDSRLKFLMRMLELKTLYILKDDDLENRIHAALRYFRRENFANKDSKTSLINFGNAMGRLVHVDFGYKLQFTQKVLKDIQNSNFIAERAWLLSVGEAAVKRLA